MRSKVISIILLPVFIFLNSCKKDKDTTPPVVTVTSPNDNSSYNVYDKIVVSGTASDENTLKSVSIKLVDANSATAQNSISVDVSSNSVSFQKDYYLYDIHLETGIYYIVVTASDGVSDTRVYRKIQITEVPDRRRGVYVITAPSSLQTEVNYVDSVYNNSLKYSYSGAYVSSAVSSYHQKFFIATSSTTSGALRIINIGNGIQEWSETQPNSSANYFMNLMSDEQYLYCSYYNEYIQKYNYNSYRERAFYSASSYYPELVVKYYDYYISEQKSKSSNPANISVFYNTGALMQQKDVGMDVVSILEKDASNLFVLGNNGTQGELKIYDFTNNFFWAPTTLSAGKVLDAVRVDNSTILIAHENGTIYKYQYSSTGLTPYITGVIASKLAYDGVNNQLLVASAKDLFYYNYTLVPSVIYTTTFTDTIKNIHILYNK